MEFENSNKLKGYLSNESKRLNIHNNYAYTYYFLRSFLKRLMYNHNETFVVNGSMSQLANTHNLHRPITDLDIVSYLDIIDSSYIIEKTINNQIDDIKFSLKEKFITTNETTNFKIICNFDKIQHMIKIDLKKENTYKKIEKPLPIIMKRDVEYKINTIPIEQHIANKIYVILKNYEKNKKMRKEMRRYKDFYDLYFLINNSIYDSKLVDMYLEHNFERFGEIDRKLLDINLLDNNFMKNNEQSYLEDKVKYGFRDIDFSKVINVINTEIKGRIK
ncbi:MAG TPA: nucleotidyl transferase AbiEii/AbiGii toxin family protein [Tenericutes bacterium]|nr:nucleotidyl transferase AbiEii/AbiGii toxin family protein [Mycoplasmatota bacterium]